MELEWLEHLTIVGSGTSTNFSVGPYVIVAI